MDPSENPEPHDTLPAEIGVPKLPPDYETADDLRETVDEGAAPTVADADDTTPTAKIGQAADMWRRANRRIATGLTKRLRNLDPELRVVGGYELRDEIGRGGCGTVYAAWDPRHERDVALKLVLHSGNKAQARFEREIKAIARLRHPTIVPLIDSGQEKGFLYLVMELVRGPDLARFAHEAHESQDVAADLSRLVAHVRDAARAIHYAHEQGILHRDLKPHNILIDQHGEPLVVDFGLAHFEDGDEITKSGATLGTPAYMPPEQAGTHEGSFDERSDVYSLGATLFHALTGSAPFQDLSGEELLLAVFRTDPPPPSQLNGRVPPELDAVVLKCMEKDPARRYGSAAELADDLDRHLRGEPVLARAVSPLGRAWRWVERNRLVAGLVVALFLTGLALIALLIQYERLLLERHGP